MFRFACLLAGLAFVPAAANACDCVRLSPEYPRFEADLDRIAVFYAVAAEGILQPDGPYAWSFHPTKELRGKGKASYRIELISDCSLGPDEIQLLLSRPVFLLLSGGSDRYEINRCVNLQSPTVEKAIRERFGEGCNR